MCIKFQYKNLKGRDRLEDLGVDGKVICGLHSAGSEQGPMVGGDSCEHCNEP
jgi:hypothetical protein